MILDIIQTLILLAIAINLTDIASCQCELVNKKRIKDAIKAKLSNVSIINKESE